MKLSKMSVDLTLLENKYYGQCQLVQRSTDPLISQTINTLLSYSCKSPIGVEESISKLTSFLLDESVTIRKFQLELLTDGLIPYLNNLYNKPRLHVDKNRYSQIAQIVEIITSHSTDYSHNNNNNSQVTHPAITLQSLDVCVIVTLINFDFYYYYNIK